VSDGVNFVPFYTNPSGIDEDSYTEWTSNQTTVPANKVWHISFNKLINQNYVTNHHFYVLGEDGVLVPTILSVSIDQKAVLIEPVEPYKLSENYTLYIKKGVKSLDGLELLKSIKMDFNIS